MNHGLLGQKGITATTDAVDLLSLSRNLAMRGVGGERCSPDGNSSGVGGFCHSSLISSSNGKASGSLMRFGKYFFRFWWVSGFVPVYRLFDRFHKRLYQREIKTG